MLKLKNIDVKDDKVISLECKIDNKMQKIFPKIIVSSIPLEVLYNITFKHIPYKRRKYFCAKRNHTSLSVFKH